MTKRPDPIENFQKALGALAGLITALTAAADRPHHRVVVKTMAIGARFGLMSSLSGWAQNPRRFRVASGQPRSVAVPEVDTIFQRLGFLAGEGCAPVLAGLPPCPI